jgi:hypothetical protein
MCLARSRNRFGGKLHKIDKFFDKLARTPSASSALSALIRPFLSRRKAQASILPPRNDPVTRWQISPPMPGHGV